MDPEIAAARASTETKNKQKMTVADAFQMWIDRTIRELGEGSPTLGQYLTIKKKFTAWADAHGAVHIQEVTPVMLEKWYSSPEWTTLSQTTRCARWVCVRSIFSYLADRGVIDKSPAARIKAVKAPIGFVQGPYTEAQITAIFAAAERNNLPHNLLEGQLETYRGRLTTFMRLLLNTGLDVLDGVLHEPGRIETHQVNGRQVDVYRYCRIKTGVEAVIPIQSDFAAELRTIPMEPDTSEDMPFKLKSDVNLRYARLRWSRRIKTVLDAANVKFVEIPRRSKGSVIRKPANAKMFRHTFAVRALNAGQRPEEVAKMLGHKGTHMVLTHYAPWVKERDDAHIRRVVLGWQ
jgi:integrase